MARRGPVEIGFGYVFQAQESLLLEGHSRHRAVVTRIGGGEFFGAAPLTRGSRGDILGQGGDFTRRNIEQMTGYRLSPEEMVAAAARHHTLSDGPGLLRHFQEQAELGERELE